MPARVGKRTVEETADRMVAMFALYAKAMRAPSKTIENCWGIARIRKAMNAEERSFYRTAKPSMDDRSYQSWGVEAAAQLAWSLGIGPKRLRRLSQTIDPQEYISILRKFDRDALIAKCEPRTADELTDAVIRIEEMHWRFRDARLRGRKPPKSADDRIVYMRHMALNWLLSKDRWEDITTDT